MPPIPSLKGDAISISYLSPIETQFLADTCNFSNANKKGLSLGFDTPQVSSPIISGKRLLIPITSKVFLAVLTGLFVTHIVLYFFCNSVICS